MGSVICFLLMDTSEKPMDAGCPPPPQPKKADVVKHPGVFDHVGLLVNQPPSDAGVPFF